MAYYLTITKGKRYIPIDISKLKEFKRMSRYKTNSYSLEEIDSVTTFFEENEFIEILAINNLIDESDRSKKISIRYKSKDEYKVVHYGPVYKNKAKYLNVLYLRHLIHSLKDDKEFLRKLTTHYRNSYINCGIINQIRILNEQDGYFNTNMTNLIDEFIHNEIYRWDDKTKTEVIKYKSLHDLAMFVANYVEVPIKIVEEDKNHKRTLQKEVPGQISFF